MLPCGCVGNGTTEQIVRRVDMKGWVTWLAVAGFSLLAVVDFYNGDYDAAMTKLAGAGGLLGIGRKIDKDK
jgi:hypothetical protein